MDKGMEKGFKGSLRRLCVAAPIYHIWMARNKRIFEDAKLELEVVATKCVHAIRNVLWWCGIVRSKLEAKRIG
ncbi:hypothetical protein Leryth_026233 [Lithospermum erythrorhizon]|nr:hypothetical protein Leryth_026233 [Lithospermum erythrorhizon]